MKKAQCADCGRALEDWEAVYLWPGVGEICENCLESSVYELSAVEAAARMGIEGRPAGEGRGAF